MKLSPTAIALAIAAALTTLHAPVVQAQESTSSQQALPAGTISGHVKASSRSVSLDGARVTVGGRSTQTDALGNFRVAGLPAGTHTVVVDYLGYQRREIAVTIGADAGVALDVTMVSTTATDATNLQSVEVRGIRDAQAQALNQQRTSGNYVNVVSADLLGQFPDNNIAESTQRIPGISIERDQGEGRYVTMRGAPKEFTTVSMDGVQLANPDPTTRGVMLDTIPADVIAAMEVTKALTPDMDADAIAGNINIRTQSALDREGMTLRASAGMGRWMLEGGENERASATIGNRFGAGRNIGALVSASYSRQGRMTDNVETVFMNEDGRILPEVTEIKDYDGTRKRTGVTGRFDFQVDPNHLLYLIGSHSRFTDAEYRNNTIIEYERHTADSNEVTGTAGRATFDRELRKRDYDKSIRTVNLGGEHHLGDAWRVDWQASNSKATMKADPRDQFVFRSSVRPQMRYDYSNPDFPVWTILGRSDAPATGVNLPESWYGFRRYNDRYEYGEEEETALRLDFTRDQSFLGEHGQVKFGLRSRARDKFNNDDRRRNSSGADFAALGTSYSQMLCQDLSNNFGYFLTGRRFCQDIFGKYAPAMTGSDNNALLEADSIVGDYTASEDVNAAYFRLDAEWGPLSLITGVRYERTRIGGGATQVQLDEDDNVIDRIPMTVNRSYDHVLPSAHLRYEFSQDSILRASYSTAINRPNFYMSVPYRTIGETDLDPVSAGNPALEATFSHNFDISYEHYLRPLGLVSVALFHKRLKDPMFIATSEEPVTGGLREVTRPENGDSGSIHGVELAWQQSLDFLPAPFDGFGVYTNYTWAKSSADLPFGIGKTELPGTSRHNYNVAVSYEKQRFNARLAYTYRSKAIQEFNVSHPHLNVYWDERSSLDLTASYRIAPQWRLFLEASNLTDERQRRFQGERNRVLEYEGFGRVWLAGVKFEL